MMPCTNPRAEARPGLGEPLLRGKTPSKQALTARMAEVLERCRHGRERIIGEGGLKPPYRRLAGWQSARLAWTHRDLLQSKRYGPPARYFLSDLYGERDYTGRDEGMERIAPAIVRVMPEGALSSILLGMEMHALSQELDIAMVRQLEKQYDATGIDAAAYGEAYRACGNEAERGRQIELVGEIGHALDQVVHRNLIYNTVRLARGPAHMAGLGELHDFIERGFVAFRHMEGADEFLASVTGREREVMEAILAGRPEEEWAPPPSWQGLAQARA